MGTATASPEKGGEGIRECGLRMDWFLEKAERGFLFFETSMFDAVCPMFGPQGELRVEAGGNPSLSPFGLRCGGRLSQLLGHLKYRGRTEISSGFRWLSLSTSAEVFLHLVS